MAEKEEEVKVEVEEAELEADAEEAVPKSEQGEEKLEGPKTWEAPEEEKELSLEEQLEKAKIQADDNYNNYLRAVADLDTYKPCHPRKGRLAAVRGIGLLESILPIYDNMALGFPLRRRFPIPRLSRKAFGWYCRSSRRF